MGKLWKQEFIAPALVAALIGLAAATGTVSATGSTAAPDHVALTWTADPLTTQTITWRTSPDVKIGMVRYQEGDAFTASAATAYARAAAFTNDLGEDVLFTAEITGLKENTTYAYQVGDGKAWSPAGAFTTGTSGDFEFLVFGDSQSGSAQNPVYGPWKETLHNAVRDNPGARFFVNVGDLTEIGHGEAHWNAWFDAAAGVIDRIPEMAVQGNHETFVPGSGEDRKPDYLTRQLPVPQNGPEGLKGQAYSYDYGCAHFVVLDSQQWEEQPLYGDILKAQAAWLEQDLVRSRKPWTFVFFHKPPYSNTADRTNDDVKAAFGPVLDAHHADVVFNGHDHDYSRTFPMVAGRPMDDFGRGTVYLVVGRSGNKSYDKLTAKSWNAFFYNPSDQPMYVDVKMSAGKMTVTSRKSDGTRIEEFSISKKVAGISKAAPANNRKHPPAKPSAAPPSTP
jgi:acid phosphatase type 7